VLPFTHAQFIEVFAAYNEAVWPTQIVAYMIAAAMLGSLLLMKSTLSGRIVSAGLGMMWLWTGIAYHWLQFTSINQAAWAFGALFLLQGLLFLFASARGMLRFEAPTSKLSLWVGWGLIVYAAVLYPLLGAAMGSGYPEVPMFGITPCPVTLFTFGLLVLSSAKVAWWLLVIPVAWSLVGGSAAFLLHVPQDWPLLVSGLTAFLIGRNLRSPTLKPPSQG
jgi:hypothetical protein